MKSLIKKHILVIWFIGDSIAPLSKSRLRRNVWNWACISNAYKFERRKCACYPYNKHEGISINEPVTRCSPEQPYGKLRGINDLDIPVRRPCSPAIFFLWNQVIVALQHAPATWFTSSRISWTTYGLPEDGNSWGSLDAGDKNKEIAHWHWNPLRACVCEKNLWPGRPANIGKHIRLFQYCFLSSNLISSRIFKIYLDVSLVCLDFRQFLALAEECVVQIKRCANCSSEIR